MLDWNVFFLRFETEINRIASFPKKNVMIIYMYYGLFKKNPKNEDSEFPGIFWKKYVSTTPVWILFWNSPIMLKYGQLELKKNPPHFREWVQVGYQFKRTPHFKGNHEKRRQLPLHSLLLHVAKVYKKNFMAPFHGWVQLPQG